MDLLKHGYNILTGQQPTGGSKGAKSGTTQNKTNGPKINNNQRRENYTNMGANLGVGHKPNYLPNLEIPPQNYPVENIKQIKDTSLYAYPNPNEATDTYFNQNMYEENVRHHQPVGRDPQQIYSLTGNWLNSEQFKFNNMRPFVGGKATGYTYDTQIAESILDNYVGAGSQVIKKIEQAPLFRPEENVQWALGMPVQTDFIQSRINPSWKDNSVKPFESEKVGPGIGLGFTSQGMGGYNSGMLVRDQWIDKTVDELRVATNPRIEYDLFGHEGPGNNVIKNRGIIGRVEKNRPDRFYIQGQDRWLTTTGASQGERLRPIEELGVINRNDGETFYPGPAGTQDGPQVGRAPTAFEPTKRTQLDDISPTGSSAVGRGGLDVNMESQFRSYSNYPTHRSSTVQPRTFSSGFSSAIGAVLAPITDVLRSTKREEMASCGKMICTSGAKYAVPKDPVYNPQDVAPTTVRETTLYGTQFNINNQAGLYVDNAIPGMLPQRATTSAEFMGSVGGAATSWGDINEYSYRNQVTGDKTPTLYNRPALGNLNLFNSNIGSVCSKPDANCGDPYFGSANNIIKMPGNLETYGHMTSRFHDDIPGSAARNQSFVVEQYLNNPFIPAPFSLTSSA